VLLLPPLTRSSCVAVTVSLPVNISIHIALVLSLLRSRPLCLWLWISPRRTPLCSHGWRLLSASRTVATRAYQTVTNTKRTWSRRLRRSMSSILLLRGVVLLWLLSVRLLELRIRLHCGSLECRLERMHHTLLVSVGHIASR